MSLKNLLTQENLAQVEINKYVLDLYNKITSSYSFHPNTMRKHFINNERAYIYFNGNTRIYIDGKNLSLTGFGLRDCPGATLSKVPGCGDEGTVKGDLTFIVNALATYEKIYPR